MSFGRLRFQNTYHLARAHFLLAATGSAGFKKKSSSDLRSRLLAVGDLIAVFAWEEGNFFR